MTTSFKNFPKDISAADALLSTYPTDTPVLMILAFSKPEGMTPEDQTAHYAALHVPLKDIIATYKGEYASGEDRKVMTLYGPPAMYSAIIWHRLLGTHLSSFETYYELKLTDGSRPMPNRQLV
ncbi:MAG: hypothetical protein EON60_06270 [Alphaproteobacteria bacterium]|nr:MAG: hypothetical protein EON60_06270 [Alphaproteobacteria bacterium]